METDGKWDESGTKVESEDRSSWFPLRGSQKDALRKGRHMTRQGASSRSKSLLHRIARLSEHCQRHHGSVNTYLTWLVVWNMNFIFSIYWE